MQEAAAIPPAQAPQGQKSKAKQITRDWFWWLPPRLRNSPYWLIAIVIHLVLFLLFTIWIVFDVYRPGALDGSFYDGGGQEGVDVQPPPASQQVAQQLTNQAATTTQNFTQLAQAISTVGVGEWSVAAPTEVASAVSNVASSVSGAGKGIPGAYTGRIGSGRRGLLSKKGGTSNVETSVNNALRWLKNHQNDDGSWGDQWKPSMTGLAVLCFLAHGDVQGSPEYGSTVEKGVNWLIQNGKDHGGKIATPGGKAGYQHAIAALALAENYAMAPTVPDLEEATIKALSLIVRSQSGAGDWAYEYSGEGDTSIAGWNMQALKAGQLGQLPVEGIDNALQQSAKMLRSRHSSGNFLYKVGGHESWALRGVGIYNLQLILDKVEDGKKEWMRTTEVTGALEAMMKDKRAEFDWDKTTGWVLYGWYYNTYASFFAEGHGQNWTWWNAQFRDPLIRQQQKDGHWGLPPGEVGYMNEVMKRNTDSDVYATALCCLMLQVYWRHLTTG